MDLHNEKQVKVILSVSFNTTGQSNAEAIIKSLPHKVPSDVKSCQRSSLAHL